MCYGQSVWLWANWRTWPAVDTCKVPLLPHVSLQSFYTNPVPVCQELGMIGLGLVGGENIFLFFFVYPLTQQFWCWNLKHSLNIVFWNLLKERGVELKYVYYARQLSIFFLSANSVYYFIFNLGVLETGSHHVTNPGYLGTLYKTRLVLNLQ